MIICYDVRSGYGCKETNPDGNAFCHNCRMPLDAALRLHNPGAAVGNYRIQGVIGWGGAGAVYDAEVGAGAAGRGVGTAGDRVALKQHFDQAGFNLLAREFAVLNLLRHSGLPRYYETFEAGNQSYLVMELVPGQNLEEVLQHQPGGLDEERVLFYALQLCDVLAYLHAQTPRLLHRDIKPANIRLTPGRMIKLVDFGLVKQVTQQTHSLSRVMFTTGYSPLEQYSPGGTTEPGSDLYSLGATLYYLLTGHTPEDAISRVTTIPDPLAPPQQWQPHLSPHVADAVLRAMAVRQTDRYATAQEFKDALLGAGRQIAGTLQDPGSDQPTRYMDVPPGPATVQPASGPPPARRIGPLRVLAGHTHAVRGLAFTPDGATLASASEDGTVGLWQPASGALRQVLAGHQAIVTSVACAPDGRRVLSGSEDGTLRVWSTVGGAPMQVIDGHAMMIFNVAWAPDGRRLVATGSDGAVRVWDAGGRLLHTLAVPEGTGTGLACDPYGTILAAGAGVLGSAAVRLWTLAEARPLARLTGHPAPITSLAFTPDGFTLAAASGVFLGQIRLWHVVEHRTLAVLSGHARGVTSVACAPGNHLLASGSDDGLVFLWRRTADLWELAPVAILEGATAGINAVAFAPDGRTLAAASADSLIYLWTVPM